MDTRRGFIFGATVALGGAFLPNVALALPSAGKRLLRLGVLSDVHIGPPGSDEVLLKELAYLDSQKVEAVVFPGDFSNNGDVREMDRFMACWEKVFPNGRAADGRKVENVVVTGNHDLACNEAWEKIKWRKWTPERMDADRFFWKGNNERLWRKYFGVDWAPVWRREINGVVFICAQYGNYNEQYEVYPSLERYFLEHAKDFADGKPFFFVQHAHPKDTCYADLAKEDGAIDNGTATRALSRFPNAIALTGHSHIPLTEERSVWQGAFTSIGCGCAGTVATSSYGGVRRQPNTDLFEPQGSRAGMVIDLYPDHLVIARRSFFYDEPVGPDWVVPLPAKIGGRYDFGRRARERAVPEFPKDATVKVSKTEKGVRLSWPQAKGGRIFDYVVAATAADGKRLFEKKTLSPDYHLPDGRTGLDGFLVVKEDELPPSGPYSVSVTPRNCYYGAGRPLVVTVRN